MLWRFLGIAILLMTVANVSGETKEWYTASVVQYHPIIANDNESTKETNAWKYVSMIENSPEYGDIIVFPEYGLVWHSLVALKEKPFKRKPVSNNTSNTGLLTRNSKDMKFYRQYYASLASRIPSPSENVVICGQDQTFPKWLTLIACAVQKKKVYVVINVFERVNCEGLNCPSDGFFLYNTNVAFDREGRVVSRYRKTNLFVEPWLDKPERREWSFFTTDFNVTFVHMIDLDLLDIPSVQSILKPHYVNITFIYTTRRFDEIPFLLTMLDQMIWTNTFGVNMLTAGYSVDGGSSIRVCLNKPYLIHNYPTLATATVTATLPKTLQNRTISDHITPIQVDDTDFYYHNETYIEDENPDKTWMPRWIIEDYFDSQDYSNIPLDLSHNSATEIICVNRICCNFSLTYEFNKDLADKSGAMYHKYQLLAISAAYGYSDNTQGGIDMCLVMSCPNDNVLECGQAFPRNTKVVRPVTFTKISISRAVDLNNSDFFGPIAYKMQTFLELENDFIFGAARYDDMYYAIISLRGPQSDIRLFGINARRYDMFKRTSTYIVDAHDAYDVDIEEESSCLMKYLLVIIFLLFVSGASFYTSRRIWMHASWRRLTLRGLEESESRDVNVEMQQLSVPRKNSYLQAIKTRFLGP